MKHALSPTYAKALWKHSNCERLVLTESEKDLHGAGGHMVPTQQAHPPAERTDLPMAAPPPAQASIQRSPPPPPPPPPVQPGQAVRGTPPQLAFQNQNSRSPAPAPPAPLPPAQQQRAAPRQAAPPPPPPAPPPHGVAGHPPRAPAPPSRAAQPNSSGQQVQCWAGDNINSNCLTQQSAV